MVLIRPSLKRYLLSAREAFMKIKTQFITAMILFAFLMVAVSLSAVFTNQRVQTATAQGNLAGNIAQGANELSYLANDYVIYRENQQVERWQTEFNSFSKDVASLNASTPEQQSLVNNIQANTQRLNDVFNSVVSVIGNSTGNTVDPALLPASSARVSPEPGAGIRCCPPVSDP